MRRRILCDGRVLKRALKLDQSGDNLLKADAWRGWQSGFAREEDTFVCDNGADAQAQRGVSQTVVLNQEKPEPIIATAWSKAEGVGGTRDSDYSLYLDLRYTDGTPLWGQVDSWTVGTHDWEKAQVIVFPEKPVASVSFYMLLRGHAGKAWFRDPELKVVRGFLFDGVPVEPGEPAEEGFQVRDVAAETDFVAIQQSALDLKLDCRTQENGDATFFDVTLQDTTGKDRAVTLVYAVPLPAADRQWLSDPRRRRLSRKGASISTRRDSTRGPTAACPAIRSARSPARMGAWPWASTWRSRRSSASATTPARGSCSWPTTSA